MYLSHIDLTKCSIHLKSVARSFLEPLLDGPGCTPVGLSSACRRVSIGCRSEIATRHIKAALVGGDAGEGGSRWMDTHHNMAMNAPLHLLVTLNLPLYTAKSRASEEFCLQHTTKLILAYSRSADFRS
jgi:hypothetical protein